MLTRTTTTTKKYDIIDIEAFKPVPVRKLKIDGELFDLLSPEDVSASAYVWLLSQADGVSELDVLNGLQETVQAFVPSLSRERIDKLSIRELQGVIQAAKQYVQAPPSADEESEVPLAESQSE